ncbi:hypothetical protein ACH5RR_036946 [Cinchona calisaya]|uniref:Secreted protein n=1 Tax=Cinchona calisaya TaxID=153742 RepID=A0ABD2Y4P0_9GENT
MLLDLSAMRSIAIARRTPRVLFFHALFLRCAAVGGGAESYYSILEVDLTLFPPLMPLPGFIPNANADADIDDEATEDDD